MVSESKTGKRKALYCCDVCGFCYDSREFALRCEDYCSKHHACSLDITRHAVKSVKH